MDIKVKDWFSIMEYDNCLDEYIVLGKDKREVFRTCSLESLLSEYGENNILKMNIEPFDYDNAYDVILCLDVDSVKEDDILWLDSENGLTYRVEIININNWREPSMKYAVDLMDCNGVRYTEAYGDYYFCGQDFIDKCRKEL